jgi:hypothetical protein
LAIGFVAPRYDLRTLLIACGALMVLTGIAGHDPAPVA